MSDAWAAWCSPARTPAHATEPVAERIADLHFPRGEGPVIDAVLDGGPVAAPTSRPPHASGDDRRSRHPPRRRRAGTRHEPTRVGPTRIGLLGLYSRPPTVLGAERAAEVDAIRRDGVRRQTLPNGANGTHN